MFANGRWYLCKHAKKEYRLTEIIKCEQFVDNLKTGTIVDRINSSSQQLFKFKKEYLKDHALVGEGKYCSLWTPLKECDSFSE